jgi:hypothetical protein
MQLGGEGAELSRSLELAFEDEFELSVAICSCTPFTIAPAVTYCRSFMNTSYVEDTKVKGSPERTRHHGSLHDLLAPIEIESDRLHWQLVPCPNAAYDLEVPRERQPA